MEYLSKLLPLITSLLSKENNMIFTIGFVLGAVVGGLVATFVVPMFWKPKV